MKTKNKTKTKKTTKKAERKRPLPKNWKTIVLYNVNSETACFELSRDESGKIISPIHHKGIDDWIASVTLIEGTPLGMEDYGIKVGEQMGFAIINRLWF